MAPDRTPPTCSIVIPVHNRVALTTQLLNRLLAPTTGVDAEIVVVDDGSSDLTQTALTSYGDAIQVIRHDRATGFGIACNEGAAATTGDYLILLNNDTIPTAGWLHAL